MNVRTLSILLAAACQITSYSAQAGYINTLEEPGIKSIWVNAGFHSYHFNRNKGLKENNYGLGVQVVLSQTRSVMAGEFRNSVDACSRYLAWVWQPYNIGPVKLGLLAGGMDGYPKMRDGGWFPFVMPVASFEYKAVGMNFTVIPNYKDRLDGAVAMQFKLRVW
ncbi:MAG: hypothetical protein OEV35_08230 [Gallionellaceae bacterium]|nr:hypothetical protein [Gallionellaceae bacterium]